MKSIISKSIYIALLISGLFLYNACEDDKTYELGESFSKIEGINGNWKLVEVQQLDEISGDEDEKLDVSALMIGAQPAEMSFQSSDRSFSVSAGTSKTFFPDSGSWAFDNDDYPEKLVLSKDGGTTELKLEASVREKVDPFLIFKYIRPIGNCIIELEDGQPLGAISYVYKFERK